VPTRLHDVPYFLFALAVSIVVGFMFFMQVLASVDYARVPLPAPALLGILLPLFVFAAVACHEAGHVLAALLMRLSVQQFAVGPWLLIHDTKGFHLRSRHGAMKPLAGFVIAVPTRADRLGRRHFIFTIGGPIASLVICLLCLIPAIVLNHTTKAPGTPMLEMGWPLTGYWIPRSWTAAFLMMGALTNLEGFLISIVPGRVSGWKNDAALLLAWNREPGTMAREWIIGAVRELDTAIDQLNQEKKHAVAVQEFEKAADLRDSADRLRKKRETLIGRGCEPSAG
jgi:hypothetical protein